MENEYQVLAHLQNNEKTSQRVIAQHTGLSLGAVNILIKKMVRKGFLKVDKLNSRTMRYVLTPQGIKEKTRLTYHFVRNSYHQIVRITNAVEKLITSELSRDDFSGFALYGPPDEIEQILKNIFGNMRINTDIIRPDQSSFVSKDNRTILIWRPEDEEAASFNSNVFNVMKLV